MAPMRSLRRPFTTRQTAANQSRSLRNSSEPGASVCSVVSEYGMPYCFRLLHADILPQKLSRRSAMVIRPGVSGVAWISTGTSRPALRRVSAMARSSPKFGSVTMTPSILSLFLRNSSAQRVASARLVMAPHLVSSAPSHDHAVAGVLDDRDHFLAAALRQMVRKEPAVADDDAESHLAQLRLESS